MTPLAFPGRQSAGAYTVCVLVGREEELSRLERLLAGARVGTSGVLVLCGDPGIGKTSLLEHSRRHTTGMRVLSAVGMESEQDLAFGGLHQLCTPLLGLLGELPGPQVEALGVALALREGPRPERFAVGAALLGLLTRAAEDTPLAVFVDDAHLLDDSSAQAIVFAARRLENDAVAVVAAQRDEPTSGLAGLTVLRLGPLGVAATRDLLPGPNPWTSSADALTRFHEATGGNPLAIVELATDAERLLAAPPHSPLPLSGTLQDAFLRRLGPLSPQARSVLVLAAADSRDLTTLAAACEGLGLSLGALAEAESAGLVRVTDRAVEFRHPLVRAAVYGAADPTFRRQAHRALAESVPATEPARRAWHRAEAALGPDEEAAVLLAAAGAESAQRAAYAEAASQWERAAALTADTEARARRLRSAGEQAWLAGATDRAGVLLGRSLDLATAPRERALAMAGLAQLEASSGSLVRARDLQLAAADLAEPHDRTVAAMALADAVAASLYLCDAATARQVGDRLTAMTGPGAEPIVNHLGSLAAGVALVLGGEANRGPELIRTALANPVDTDSTGARWGMQWAMIGPLFLREAGANRDVVATVVQSVRERAAVGALPFLLSLIAKDAAASTAWQEADQLYAEAVRLAEETGHTIDRALGLAGWSILQARQGRVPEAAANAAEAMRLGGEHDVHLVEVWAAWARGDLASGEGRVAEAEAGYEDVLRRLEGLGLSDPDLSPVPELVELGVAADRGAALRAATEFLDAALLKGQPWALARAHRGVGLALGGEEAEAEFATALELHERTPDVYEGARTQLAYGAHLRRSRRRVEARPLLRAALATFEQLGAAPWADRAAAELEATGERAVRRGAGASAALTPQERQISALLAEGRTTREAAAALFLSPKTVEYHLRHVYLKLGISSREELAALVADG